MSANGAPREDAVRALYQARAAGDLDAVRALLAPDVVWHEPDVGEHTGDLHGPDAVIAMLAAAAERTGGTFALKPRTVLAHGRHVVALIDWSAERAGRRLHGKEIAVFAFTGNRIAEVHFHQHDQDLDRAFWS